MVGKAAPSAISGPSAANGRVGAVDDLPLPDLSPKLGPGVGTSPFIDVVDPSPPPPTVPRLGSNLPSTTGVGSQVGNPDTLHFADGFGPYAKIELLYATGNSISFDELTDGFADHIAEFDAPMHSSAEWVSFDDFVQFRTDSSDLA
jgi:hypothetical protein